MHPFSLNPRHPHRTCFLNLFLTFKYHLLITAGCARNNLSNLSLLSVLTTGSIVFLITRGYSSVVEHSTADREVPGSNPGAPFVFGTFARIRIDGGAVNVPY